MKKVSQVSKKKKTERGNWKYSKIERKIEIYGPSNTEVTYPSEEPEVASCFHLTMEQEEEVPL